jgi:hypothetical protein
MLSRRSIVQLFAALPLGVVMSSIVSGETPTGLVRCANLIYARSKTSVCFASQFLAEVRKLTHINTDSSFTPVKLEDDDLLRHPFAVMTGEGGFNLTPEQRDCLRRYLTSGGFLLASAGCSSEPWDSSFRRELAQIMPDRPLVKLPMDHPVFNTVHEITKIRTKNPKIVPELEALVIDDRIVLVYSPHGLNDTSNAGGNCCCCGGNEILDARRINVNLLAYALTH